MQNQVEIRHTQKDNRAGMESEQAYIPPGRTTDDLRLEYVQKIPHAPTIIERR
jgi:hypothetical protein